MDGRRTPPGHGWLDLSAADFRRRSNARAGSEDLSPQKAMLPLILCRSARTPTAVFIGAGDVPESVLKPLAAPVPRLLNPVKIPSTGVDAADTNDRDDQDKRNQ